MAMNLMNPVSMLQLHHHVMLQRQQQILMQHHYGEDMQAGWQSMLSAPMNGPRLQEKVKVSLENRKLWKQFHAETTEMIITKSGRRMFPSVQLALEGLDPTVRYCILMELCPSTDRRHKYVGGAEAAATAASTTTTLSSPGVTKTQNSNNSIAGVRGWTSAGPAEPQPPVERRLYLHPDSPASGAHWMQHPLSFSKLKLTNNIVEHHSNILLTSMHKYMPRVWIIRCDDLSSIRDLYSHPSAYFNFPETEFIAVTAYQNENITKLKIDNNPFAKGFRESGQSSCKRKRQQPTSSSSSSSSTHEDEEDCNASFASDSDPNDSEAGSVGPVSKRMRCDIDESCCVSSSDNNTPPPAPARAEPEPRKETQPKLHRPWADDDEDEDKESARPISSTSVETAVVGDARGYESISPPTQHQYQPQHTAQPCFYGVQPSPYHHLMAFELARMARHRYVAATHHLPSIMDYRI